LQSLEFDINEELGSLIYSNYDKSEKITSNSEKWWYCYFGIFFIFWYLLHSLLLVILFTSVKFVCTFTIIVLVVTTASFVQNTIYIIIQTLKY